MKTDSEDHGRKLWLIWYSGNNEQSFAFDKFRPKSSFNPKNKDFVIETNLKCLEKRLLEIEILFRRYNLTRGEQNALHNLKADTNVIKKSADKEFVVV